MADEFRTTEVGGRYAQALFDLARETDRLDAVRADLRSLRAAWHESPDLRRLATSPVVGTEDQVLGFKAVAGLGQFEATTTKFLGLLAQNGRTRDLPAVIAGFETLYSKHTGMLSAEVVSAVRLDSTQLTQIRSALKQSLGRTAELTTRVDPSILGGIKVKVGSRLFDASLKTKLDQMKFALKRA